MAAARGLVLVCGESPSLKSARRVEAKDRRSHGWWQSHKWEKPEHNFKQLEAQMVSLSAQPVNRFVLTVKIIDFQASVLLMGLQAL
jgi:hypothetical protein